MAVKETPADGNRSREQHAIVLAELCPVKILRPSARSMFLELVPITRSPPISYNIHNSIHNNASSPNMLHLHFRAKVSPK